MKEKWNLGLRFDQNSPIKEADLSDKQIQAIKESARRDVSVEIRTELKKTVEEERMINRINEAIKIFFDFYKLPPLTISANSVHIVPIRKIKDESEGNGAYIRDGNIFLSRTEDINDFIQKITHEIAHEISHAQFTLYKDGENNLFTEQKKGFRINTKANEGEVGRGFNEGMTELIADKIRLIYAEIAQLGTRRIETLANRLAYLPQILIIEAVFNTINPNDYNEGFNLFAKAFITGDKKIYKIISDKFKEQGIKDGLKILMSMGTTLTDALQTAQQLGLIDATQKIEALVKEAEQTSN